MVSIFVEDLERERIKREADFVQALSKGLAAAPLDAERAISDYKAWKAEDDVLVANVRTAEELQLFVELAKSEPVTATGPGNPRHDQK